MPPNLHVVRVFGILALLAACTDAPPPPSRPTIDVATVEAIRAESARAARVSALPRSSVWDLDRVSERLVRAGVNPRAVDTMPEVPEYLAGVAAGRFRVGRGGDLLVFLFADSLARRDLSTTLDPLTAAPPGAESPWGANPTLILSNNLLAVLVGGSSVLRERVQLAIEAGLPAAGGT